MSEFDFQKLGNDRFSQNIKRAITNPVGNLTTGSLTAGSKVVVEFDGTSANATATVSPRRTGAILISVDLNAMNEIHWSISGTTLSVRTNTARTGTVTFWVF